ncbi:MAG TPA: DUF488 domain-containing protein [Dehalococcoidia bacterium]|nr:DUF488 domain-containing protein [Dehalococcoidia bacterium]
MSEDEGADIYTIGHSTRSLEELVEALRSHGVQMLVDIRSVPRSRHVPQFNQDVLAEALPAAGIEYGHMPALGGWRKGSLPDSPNAGWRSPGFRAYADHMLSDEFADALERLTALARQRPIAYMCAEATPYRCHRSLVSDALTARGLRVRHIMGPGTSQAHRLTSFARMEGGRVTYPPPG